jgi:hypothetical protein
VPFVVVMLVLCCALVTELRTDPGAGFPRQQRLHGLRDAVRAMVGEAISEAGPERHRRLRRLARRDPGPDEPGPDA